MPKPLRHAIIASHPDANSFTLAIARDYAEAVRSHGHEAIVRDLYQRGFDPVLNLEERNGEPGADVLAEWETLGEIDVFVLVYPIWFGAPPAMIKGYIDRVFGAGRTRGSSERGRAAGRALNADYSGVAGGFAAPTL